MSEPKRTIKVKILGNELSLRTDDPQEHIDAVVNYVNEKISYLLGHAKSSPIHIIAILCALNIADEFLKLKMERSNMGKNFEDRLKKITVEIADALK